jgi:hypothetical protein
MHFRRTLLACCCEHLLASDCLGVASVPLSFWIELKLFRAAEALCRIALNLETRRYGSVPQHLIRDRMRESVSN